MVQTLLHCVRVFEKHLSIGPRPFAICLVVMVASGLPVEHALSQQVEVEEGERGSTESQQTTPSLSAALLGQPLETDFRWGSPRSSYRGALVVLGDGSHLTARRLSLTEDGVTLVHGLFGERQISWELVRGIIFSPPHDARRTDQLLATFHQAEPGSDRLETDAGDVMLGLFLGEQGGALQWEIDRRVVSMARERVRTLILDPELATPTEEMPRRFVGLRDGSLLRATELEMTEQMLAVELSGIGRWESMAGVDLLREVVFLQTIPDAVKYLATFEPLEYQHVPYLSGSWPLGVDQTPAGGRLRVGNQLYPFGISMRSGARVEYAIAMPARRFQAELAIDDSAAIQGSVVASVEVANEEGEWTERYRSNLLYAGAAPLPVEVDLSGAVKIALVVEYGRGADVGDLLDWLNARITFADHESGESEPSAPTP